MKTSTPIEDRTLDAIGQAVYDQNGSMVAGIFPPGEQDVARRMVACWNLLRGIQTEEIERGHVAVKQITNHVAVSLNNGSISIGGNN